MLHVVHVFHVFHVLQVLHVFHEASSRVMAAAARSVFVTRHPRSAIVISFRMRSTSLYFALTRMCSDSNRSGTPPIVPATDIFTPDTFASRLLIAASSV